MRELSYSSRQEVWNRPNCVHMDVCVYGRGNRGGQCMLGQMITQHMTNNVRKSTFDTYAQRRLKSTCTSAQSNQGLCCPHEATLYSWPSKMRSMTISEDDVIRFLTLRSNDSNVCKVNEHSVDFPPCFIRETTFVTFCCYGISLLLSIICQGRFSIA